MIRRIIKQGNNSYTLTLPISWVRDNNIEGGSEVDIDTEDNDINISLLNKKPLITKINVDLKEYSKRSIKNIVFQLYRKGYDQIICTIKNEEQKEALKKVVNKNVLGFEIVSENNNTCIIENVAEPSKEKYNSLLNKLFFIIKTNLDDIIKDLSDNNLDRLEHHIATKDMFDVYTNFLRRIVIKENVGGSKDSYINFYFLSQLSYIQHSYYYTYQYFVKKNAKADKVIIDSLTSSKVMVELLHDSFIDIDLDKAHIIGNKFRQIKNDLLNHMDDPKVKTKSVIYNILEGIRFIHLASTVIFGFLDKK